MLQRDLHICHLRLLVGDFCIGWLQQQLLQLPHTKITISNSPLSSSIAACPKLDSSNSCWCSRVEFEPRNLRVLNANAAACLQHLTVKAHSTTAIKWCLPPSLCAVCQITLKLNDWIQFAIENTPPTETETETGLDLTQVIYLELPVWASCVGELRGRKGGRNWESVG